MSSRIMFVLEKKRLYRAENIEIFSAPFFYTDRYSPKKIIRSQRKDASDIMDRKRL